MSLAVAVEESQTVETLVVLRETAETEEETADAHFHQHAPLVGPLGGQSLGHLYHLGGRLWLPLALARWGLRGGLLLRGGRLWGGGGDR